jgi:membrane protease YdiL (CAAX protease family)
MNVFLLEDGRLRAGWRFAVAIVAVLIANIAAGSLAATVADKHVHVEDAIYRPLLALFLFGCFFGMARLFDQPEGSTFTYLGFPSRQWLRQTLQGALFGFVLVFGAIVIIAIFFNYHITQITLSPRSLRLPPLVLFVLLTGAMAEELMFRGYPFQRLVEWIGPAGSILVLSALFGAAHLSNPHISDSRAVQVFAFCNTLLIGVLLALAYLRTRALWLPWGLHFAWNTTLGLIFGLPVSGLTTFAVLVKARVRGPDWLLGGGYGLEGGALATLMILLGFGYVLFFVKPSHLSAQQRVAEGAIDGIQPTGTI